MPDAIIAHNLGAATSRPEYEAAKAGDRSSALQLARSLVTDDVTESIRSQIGDKKPIIVPVLAIEQSGNNMIRAMTAMVIGNELGATASKNITQSVKANRSKLSALDRVFQHAAFVGAVESGADYLLVDDTLTQGGTFAALAEHIRSNGRDVIGVFVLIGRQYSAKLRLSNELLSAIREKYGDIEQDFVRARRYRYDYLTESEARDLVSFRPADTVRNRILEAGNEGSQRVGEAGTSEGLDVLRISPSQPNPSEQALFDKMPPTYRAVYNDLQAGLTVAKA